MALFSRNKKVHILTIIYLPFKNNLRALHHSLIKVKSGKTTSMIELTHNIKKEILCLRNNNVDHIGKKVLKILNELKTKKLNSVACSPQANYTDRAAAAC
jgi:hypothetical protein